MASGRAFAHILPSSASASGSSSPPPKSVRYDVFLNHRGPDTKKTVAASIYNALKAMGVEVFLDERELDLGDPIPAEIEEAMKSSFLHIAILSPTYAESPWCLSELSFMVKTGKKIIPVFYKVDPSDLRWIRKGKGRYAIALAEHEATGRYPSDVLEDWKVALEKVSNLTGHIVKNEGDEEILKAIENYVLKHPKKIPFEVAKHPVGVKEITEEFERRVFKSSDNVKVVGITGMSGCGKTTLAKEYYNRKMHSFYRYSFVSKVRDESTKLHEKQKKMFQDLGGSKEIPFNNVEEGIAILIEHLKFRKVFITLDDVDCTDQLDSLLPMRGFLLQGSVIVIISQDSDVLTSWGILSNSIYRMKELNSKYARELFCWHAFAKSFPTSEFECLVKKFLEVCRGLPLSLQVLGRLVHGKSKEYWNGILKEVSGLLPDDIKRILKVSFDSLGEEDKEAFLDISCFFIGTETHSAMKVWDESGLSGVCSLERLVNKCLVEVDDENRLRMHDQLRDLGKEISYTWSPYRLWSSQQITHIEKQGKESVPIRGLKVETEEFFKEVMELLRRSGGRFERHLKILDVANNYFTEELATFSAGLVWLRWVNCRHTALPPWVSLKKLRVLELREASELEQLWRETADLREPEINDAASSSRFPRSIGSNHLENISVDSNGPPIEGLPEASHLQRLEYLTLTGCDSLTTLPDSFGNLSELKYLNLTGCIKITSLPYSIGKLSKLKKLTLYGCSELKSLPDTFGDLTNLQDIRFNDCSELTFPSQTLAQLTSLSHLDVYKCPGFTELVIQPGCLNSSSCNLECVTLEECHVSRISISTECCPSLEQLVLGGNQYLAEIDSLPTSVKNLRIKDCGDLSKIEGLKDCMSLETLMAHTWREAPLVHSLKHMKSLRSVSLAAACYISAFEPCLQTLNRKKWPSLCTICGRAAPGVEEVVYSFTFPGLTVVHSFNRLKNYDMWEYDFLEEHPSNEAAMICLVINSASDTITLQMACVADKIFSQTRVKEGKWVFIGVFTPSSLVGREVRFFLSAAGVPLEDDSVEMGILAMGEQNRVVDAFYKLLQRFGKVSETPV